MRKILLLIFTFFSLTSFAQIDVQSLYDSSTETLTLLVKNNTGKLFRLCPFPGQDYYESGSASFIVLRYKDVSGKVLFRRSFFVSEQLPISESTKGKFLFKYGKNKYVYDLKKLYKGNINDIYEVDVHIQMEAVSLKDKKDVYKEVIVKTYRW